MPKPIGELLNIVRGASDLAKAWADVLDLCRRGAPSELWNNLPNPDIAGDVERARLWLQAQIAAVKAKNILPRGIYLGLDTLNMVDRNDPSYAPPKNVEIAFSPNADPAVLNMDWAFEQDNAYGRDHLIGSLVGMKAVYEDSDVSSFADYMLFLGYTGLILLAALEQADLKDDYIAIWGFHDGDLAYLARRIKGQYERVVKF